MNKPLHVRDMVEADLPAIRGWMRDSPYAPAWNDEVLAQLTSQISESCALRARLRRAWVADDDEEGAAGFVVAAATEIAGASAECELEFVLVAPGARRKGVGTALLQSVVRWAHALRAVEIWLEVRASNQPAISLYASGGFVPTGRRPRYYADPLEDAVSMRLRIDRPQESAPV